MRARSLVLLIMRYPPRALSRHGSSSAELKRRRDFRIMKLMLSSVRSLSLSLHSRVLIIYVPLIYLNTHPGNFCVFPFLSFNAALLRRERKLCANLYVTSRWEGFPCVFACIWDCRPRSSRAELFWLFFFFLSPTRIDLLPCRARGMKNDLNFHPPVFLCTSVWRFDLVAWTENTYLGEFNRAWSKINRLVSLILVEISRFGSFVLEFCGSHFLLLMRKISKTRLLSFRYQFYSPSGLRSADTAWFTCWVCKVEYRLRVQIK